MASSKRLDVLDRPHIGPYTQPCDEQHFRLVVLSPGQWTDPIRCRLFRFPIHESHERRPYKALSYVWGSPHVTKSIQLDNYQVQITLNLFCALLHLRQPSQEVVLWVDALCINQKDAEERGRQVSLMQLIYKNAKEVMVFIGQGYGRRLLRSDLDKPPPSHAFCEPDDSESLANFLTRCESYQRGKIPDSDTALNTVAIIHLFTDLYTASRLVEGLRTLHESVRLQLFEQLRGFLISPWWERIWVVQEVTVNQKVTMQYGAMLISWDLLESAATVVATLIHAPSEAIAKLEPENWKVLVLLERQVASIRRTREKWHSNRKTSLNHLLHEFSSRHASDDRDKVFGLLSLASPGHGVEPNYSHDVEETFRDTALRLLESSKSLDVWIGDQKRKNNKNLPSWVPDWSAISNPSDTRRLDSLDICNASDAWKLYISRGMTDYWITVLASLLQLRDWLCTEANDQSSSRGLPMFLRGPILACENSLREESSKNKYDYVKRTSACLGELARLCTCPTTQLPFQYSKLFNWTHGGIVSGKFLNILNIRPTMPRLINDSDKFFVIERSQVDLVDYVGPQLWSWADLDTALRTLFAWAGLACANARSAPTHHGDLVVSTFLGNLGNHTFEFDRERVWEFAQTLVAGAHVDDTGSITKACSEDVGALVDWLCIFLRQPDQVIEQVKKGQRLPGNSPEQRSAIITTENIPLAQSIIRATEGRGFFITVGGLTGLGPPSTQPGDTINVLPSGGTHFLLRHANREYSIPHMELIGDCYWNGGPRRYIWPSILGKIAENAEHQSYGREVPLRQLERQYLNEAGEDDIHVSFEKEISPAGSLPYGLLAPFLREFHVGELPRELIVLI